MPASATFIGIDEDGVATTDALSTGLLQRVDENAQWCRIQRAPQPALAFTTATESGGALYDMRKPQIGAAQWTCFGPVPVWVPQGADLRNQDPAAPCVIDVHVYGDVGDAHSVFVAAFSADALPHAFGAQWLEDNATEYGTGDQQTMTFSGVVVRPGVVNRIYIGVRGDVDLANVDSDLEIRFANGFGRLVSKLHTLDHASALFEQQVPYLAIASGHDGTATNQDAQNAWTVGTVFYDAGTNQWPSALIADGLSPMQNWPSSLVSQWDEAKAGGGVFFGPVTWLRIRSIAPDFMTSDVPTRVNNGALRPFQAAGTNVEQLGWTVNALDQYRQSMAFVVWPRPFPAPDDPSWPGLWRAFPQDTGPDGACYQYTAPLVIGPDRDASLSLRLVVGVMAQVFRTVGTTNAATAFDVGIEVQDYAGSVVTSIEGTIHPPIIVGSPEPLGGFGWTAAWCQLVARMAQRPIANEFASVAGQPWSHDGCVDPRDAGTLFAPCEVSIDVSALSVQTQYKVVVYVYNPIGEMYGNAALVVGAAYGRLVVGA